MSNWTYQNGKLEKDGQSLCVSPELKLVKGGEYEEGIHFTIKNNIHFDKWNTQRFTPFPDSDVIAVAVNNNGNKKLNDMGKIQGIAVLVIIVLWISVILIENILYDWLSALAMGITFLWYITYPTKNSSNGQ